MRERSTKAAIVLWQKCSFQIPERYTCSLKHCVIGRACLSVMEGNGKIMLTVQIRKLTSAQLHASLAGVSNTFGPQRYSPFSWQVGKWIHQCIPAKSALCNTGLQIVFA